MKELFEAIKSEMQHGYTFDEAETRIFNARLFRSNVPDLSPRHDRFDEVTPQRDKVPRFKFPGTPINREESPAEEKEPVSDDSSVCDSSVSSKSQSSTSSYSSSSTCHRSSRSKKKRKSKSSPVKQAQERSEEALRPAVSKRKVHQQLPDAVFQAGKERQRFPYLHKLVGYRELYCRKSI
jgi:hypothetical protein